MPFDKDFANEDDFSAMSEWNLMSLVAFVSGEDVDLNVKLRRDIATLTPAKAGSIGALKIDVFQAVALMHVIYPVKFVIFIADKDPIKINISDPFTFSSYCTEEAATLVQPVILIVIIVSSNHVDKTVV